jgi:NAD-dependent deacetylase
MIQRLRGTLAVRRLARLLDESERIVVFTGAGCSVDSGIPDFRSPDGVWSRIDPMVFSRRNLEGPKAGREAFWRAMLILADSMHDPQPNAIHDAIVKLEMLGKVHTLLTQNVDGLHQAAGNSAERVVELHGNLGRCIVPGTAHSFPTDEIIERVRMGDADPHHEGRPIRPDFVVFGDPLPEANIARAWAVARDCDLFLVLGSSLLVHPAADVPVAATRAGARLAIVTMGSTPLDVLADLRIDAPLQQTLVPAVSRLS